MVVDDDLDIITVLQSALTKAGVFIAAYTNPQKALSDYKPRDYDLVFAGCPNAWHVSIRALCRVEKA